MSATIWACEIIAGVNWTGDFPEFCQWSPGCPESPRYAVSHPILKWVITCVECVDGGRCGDVRKVRHDEYVPGVGL